MQTFSVMLMIVAAMFVAMAGAQLHPLTQQTIQANHMQASMHYLDQVMRNPHMREFYHKYYIEPQDEHKLYIQSLEKKVGDFSKQFRTQNTFGGYSPLDPNIYNRLVNTQPIGIETRKLTNKIKAWNALNKNPKVFQEPTVPPSMIAEVKETMKNLKKAERLNKLEHAHPQTYPRPFESEKMDTLMKNIKNLEEQVRRPLEPTPANPEELNALNNLNVQMEQVNQHMNLAPSEALTEETKSQEMMITRLQSMMRRMANAISADRRQSFLHALHLLLHRHRLQDHPAMISFEREIAYSIASGQPLRQSNVVDNEFSRHNFVLDQNAQDANVAKGMARQMKDYGRVVTARGKELEHRAAMSERRRVPLTQQQELEQHIKARIKQPQPTPATATATTATKTASPVATVTAEKK